MTDAPEWSFESWLVKFNPAPPLGLFLGHGPARRPDLQDQRFRPPKAHNVPHSAFDDPSCPKGVPTRTSIEMRAMRVLVRLSARLETSSVISASCPRPHDRWFSGKASPSVLVDPETSRARLAGVHEDDSRPQSCRPPPGSCKPHGHVARPFPPRPRGQVLAVRTGAPAAGPHPAPAPDRRRARPGRDPDRRRASSPRRWQTLPALARAGDLPVRLRRLGPAAHGHLRRGGARRPWCAPPSAP